MHRTENVELTVLCLITDGAKCCFKIDLGSDYDLTCSNLQILWNMTFRCHEYTIIS